VSILEDVTAQVPVGSATAIIGPNGAGKTTLLKALLGEIPFSGRILFGPDPAKPRIGYVPQRLEYDRGLPLTVTEFMAMGMQRLPLWFGVKQVWKEQASALLEKVKAGHLTQRPAGSLSAGELQRVLLALALQRQPEILVLDELDAGVDIQAEHLMCELLESLRQEQGLTQVMVSHDLPVVTAHATHVICLNRRVLGEGPPKEILVPRLLEATFGVHKGLPDLEALPKCCRHKTGGCEECARD
jgi:zinc transport system ATP-binding protein